MPIEDLDSESFRKKLGTAVTEDVANWGLNLFVAVASGSPFVSVPSAVLLALLKPIWQHHRRHMPSNYTDWRLSHRDLQRLYEADWPEAVKISYELRRLTVAQKLIADCSEGPLQLSMRLLPTEYELPAEIKDLIHSYREKLLGSLRKRGAYHTKTLDKSTSLGVKNVIREDNRVIIEVQRMNYIDLVTTHYELDVDWFGRPSLRQTLLSNQLGTLGSLTQSKLPNILGVDVLIFTASGSLVLQKRSKAVAVRPLELCASSSGGGTIEDLSEDGTLKIFREGAEELALRPEYVVPGSTRFLGIARDFVSHGVVESYFTANLRATQREISQNAEDAEDSREHSKLEFFHFGNDLVNGPLQSDVQRRRFQEKLDALLRRYKTSISTPLLAALALWATDRLRRPQ